MGTPVNLYLTLPDRAGNDNSMELGKSSMVIVTCQAFVAGHSFSLASEGAVNNTKESFD